MILLTGAESHLGSEFQKLFDRLGIKYIAVNHKKLDITNNEAVRNFLKDKVIDCIINCAAYNDVDRAEEEPDKCFALNSSATENLALASKEIGAVFVTYSTDFAFDGEKRTSYTESDVPNPTCVYSSSMADGEKRVLSVYDKTFVIRTSWVFGMGKNNFVTQVIDWSKEREKLSIVDDQVSVPTYSKDLAEYSWKLIKSEKFGLYHLSNRRTASKYDQAKYVLEKTGWNGKLWKAKTADFKLPAKRSEYSKLSSENAERIIVERIPHWKDSIDRFFEEVGEKL